MKSGQIGSNRETTGRALAVVLALAVGLTAVSAGAQSPTTVALEITVAQLSDKPGPIDPRGSKIHEKLSADFRYGGLAVVESRTMRLAIDEVGTLKLPNKKSVKIRPMLIDDRGLLMAVDVEGVLQTDLRVKSGRLVVFGAHRHGDGKLVIAVEPRL